MRLLYSAGTMKSSVVFYSVLGCGCCATRLFSIILQLGQFRIGGISAMDLSVFIQLTPTFGFGFAFTMMLRLPGNSEDSMLSAELKVTPISLQLSAALSGAAPGLPSWPGAFGVRGLDLYDLGVLAAINLQSGFPSALGFTAELRLTTSTDNYILAVAAVLGADPGNQLLKLEERHINFGFLVALIEAFIGEKVEALEVIAKAYDLISWVSLDYMLFYFSAGAQIAHIDYPPGGQLKINAKLFHAFPVDIDGQVLTSAGGAKLTGVIKAFKLGPFQIKGMVGPDASVSNLLTFCVMRSNHCHRQVASACAPQSESLSHYLFCGCVRLVVWV